jgi:hypothetical protein
MSDVHRNRPSLPAPSDERSRGFREELLTEGSYWAHQERAEHVAATEKSLEMVRR